MVHPGLSCSLVVSSGRVSLLKSSRGAGQNEGMDEMELQNRFVANVERLIRSAGMSRSELAVAMGVSRQIVTNYLNKRCSPGLKVIAEFAAGLGVDPEELFKPLENADVPGVKELAASA
jgi:ribosome-binding protein aMBF1 (putative translation factor)